MSHGNTDQIGNRDFFFQDERLKTKEPWYELRLQRQNVHEINIGSFEHSGPDVHEVSAKVMTQHIACDAQHGVNSQQSHTSEYYHQQKFFRCFEMHFLQLRHVLPHELDGQWIEYVQRTQIQE